MNLRHLGGTQILAWFFGLSLTPLLDQFGGYFNHSGFERGNIVPVGCKGRVGSQAAAEFVGRQIFGQQV